MTSSNNESIQASNATSKVNTLNRMCRSLESTENQKRFKAFPEAYCQSYGLNRDETHAVTDLDVKRMLALGAHIERIALLTSIYELDAMDIGAQQHGLSVEEFISLVKTTGKILPF